MHIPPRPPPRQPAPPPAARPAQTKQTKEARPSAGQLRTDFDPELAHADASYFDDADDLKAPKDGKTSGLRFIAQEKNIAARVQSKVKSVNELGEAMRLADDKDGGKLVPLAEGRPDRPMTVTVHGIHASPDTVRSLSGRAAEAGDKVGSFAYDDTGQGLEKTSHAFAKDIGKWLEQNPGRTLRVDAHSMGARVALRGLDILAKEGKLKGRKVEFNIVASAIDGDWRADLMGLAAPMPGLKPVLDAALPSSRDMMSNSAFQQRLDQITLPENVDTRIFTGGEDGSVSDGGGHFQAMSNRLNAVRVHFPQATHDSAVEAAAAYMDEHD